MRFHALIRLDGPGDFTPPALHLSAEELVSAITDAAASTRLLTSAPPGGGSASTLATGQHSHCGPDDRPGQRSQRGTVHEGQNDCHPDEAEGDREQGHAEVPAQVTVRGVPGPLAGIAHIKVLPSQPGLVLRFGDQVVGAGAGGELTPERVAAYLARYAAKSAEDFGLGERRLSGLALSGVGGSAHVARIVRTVWELGAVEELVGLRRWLHMLGFRGRFATKSRRYSTTLGAIRRERSDSRQRQAEGARPVGVVEIVELTRQQVVDAAGVSRSTVVLTKNGINGGVDVYRLRRIAAAVRADRLHALYVATLLLGLRRNESLALRRSDVDLDEGVPTIRRVVMQIVGHSTLDVTMRVYGHVSLDAQRTALGQLGDLLDEDGD